MGALHAPCTHSWTHGRTCRKEMIMVARAKDPTPPENVSFRRRCDCEDDGWKQKS